MLSWASLGLHSLENDMSMVFEGTDTPSGVVNSWSHYGCLRFGYLNAISAEVTPNPLVITGEQSSNPFSIFPVITLFPTFIC